jgi:hypothetical protein
MDEVAERLHPGVLASHLDLAQDAEAPVVVVRAGAADIVALNARDVEPGVVVLGALRADVDDPAERHA